MRDTQKFIGTKIIHAKPMNLGDYNEYRCWDIPKDEDPAREGYLVTCEDGHESWSPTEVFDTEVFDEAYRLCDAMAFGLALEAMKKGKKVARAGWNGKDMWLTLIEGDAYTLRDVFEVDGKLLPWIGMKTAGDDIVPWLASQTDMLAEDWMIVE